jgi:beta-glucosidase/6-phospho-beta-glucosidase/beta-galactosidase
MFLFCYYFAGKGFSIWDTYVHKHTNLIAGGSNGDVAADSYHQYMQDVAALKKLKVSTISFSISDFTLSVSLRIFMGTDICIQSQ